jgi:hypothetical protein
MLHSANARVSSNSVDSDEFVSDSSFCESDDSSTDSNAFGDDQDDVAAITPHDVDDEVAENLAQALQSKSKLHLSPSTIVPLRSGDSTLLRSRLEQSILHIESVMKGGIEASKNPKFLVETARKLHEDDPHPFSERTVAEAEAVVSQYRLKEIILRRRKSILAMAVPSNDIPKISAQTQPSSISRPAGPPDTSAPELESPSVGDVDTRTHNQSDWKRRASTIQNEDDLERLRQRRRQSRLYQMKANVEEDINTLPPSGDTTSSPGGEK